MQMASAVIKKHSKLLSLGRDHIHLKLRGFASYGFGDFEAVSPRRVVVSGLGLVTPLGIGIEKAWSRLIEGACGIKAITADDIPKEQQVSFEALQAKVAAVIDNEELKKHSEALILSSDAVRSRFIHLAVIAAAEALQDAEWHPTSVLAKARTGVAIGSGMSATTELFKASQSIAAGQPRRLSPFTVPSLLANMAAGVVSMQYGLLGPNHAASTACTTGAHAIGDAYNFIRHGTADVMLAGGTEACVDAVAIGSFSRMRALETRHNDSPSQASRPFDAARGGFVIGEGAGILLLEELEHALQRKATIYAEVRGYGLSSDAHHITQPSPDGRGAILAMERALCGSGVSKAQVAYINAHATSTPMGDAIEAAAIAEFYGFPEAGSGIDLTPTGEPISLGKGSARGQSDAEGNVRSPRPLVSSTKGATGHLLGAAGAVEAIFTVLSLRDGIAPPTLNLLDADPPILGDALVAKSARKLRDGAKAVMSNSFGFGGTNASLLFTTY